MIRTRWFTNWSPKIPGTDIDRLETLLSIQAISNEAISVPKSERVRWLRRLAAMGCLNQSQAGALIGLSRQATSRMANEFDVVFDDTHTVRARIDTRAIKPMIEMVTRLSGGDSVPAHLLLAAQTNTDKSIIAMLTGVPSHTLRTVRKNVEDQLGVRLSAHR